MSDDPALPPTDAALAALRDQISDISLSTLLGLALGRGSGIVGIVIGVAVAYRKAAARAALAQMRKTYKDDRIVILGQQIMGAWNSDRISIWLHAFGGTIWVVDAPYSKDEALAMAVFWHPDPALAVVMARRIYAMAPPLCTVSNPTGNQALPPVMRQAPRGR